MAKCRAPRKSAKRPPRRPQAADRDGELAELISVLAEYSLDDNAGGWFRPAWRNGWNAVELATKASAALFDISFDDGLYVPARELSWLEDVCLRRDMSPNIYWGAQELLPTSTKPMTRAALRCLQALIANSHGGGEVYNAILVGPFREVLPERVYDLVLEYRCRDSIGTTAQLQGDYNDRQRRAFTIAWKRGLYVAAYALPPAIDRAVGKLTILKRAD
jgi:hypothetical protein